MSDIDFESDHSAAREIEAFKESPRARARGPAELPGVLPDTPATGGWMPLQEPSQGDEAYTFNAATGRWSPSDASDAGAVEPSSPGGSTRPLTTIRLEHAVASSVSSILAELFRDVTVAVDSRTNTIIVRGGSKADRDELKELVETLDQPASEEDAPVLGLDLPRPPDRQSYSTLRQEYDQLQQEASQLARQHRDLATKSTRTPGDAESLRERLAEQVRQAFEARQELQREELAEFRRRIASIEQRIAARERIKDAIVEHRVEELLKPDLRWEDAPGPDVRPAAAPAPGRPVSPDQQLSLVPDPEAPLITTPPVPSSKQVATLQLECPARLKVGETFLLEALLGSVDSDTDLTAEFLVEIPPCLKPLQASAGFMRKYDVLSWPQVRLTPGNPVRHAVEFECLEPQKAAEIRCAVVLSGQTKIEEVRTVTIEGEGLEPVVDEPAAPLDDAFVEPAAPPVEPIPAPASEIPPTPQF